MSKSGHTEAEMVAALKQMESGRRAEDVAREIGVSKHTLYAWKAKYGGLEVSQAQELRQLPHYAPGQLLITALITSLRRLFARSSLAPKWSADPAS